MAGSLLGYLDFAYQCSIPSIPLSIPSIYPLVIHLLRAVYLPADSFVTNEI